MAKPVVMWDMDGVLANFNKAYRQQTNRIVGTSLDPNEKPEFWDSVEMQIGSENDARVWNYIKNTDGFWRDLESLATIDELERMANLEATQYFVTSRVGKNPFQETYDWLLYQFGEKVEQFPSDWSVLISSRKADAANALKANYTIDDKAGNVLAVYYNSPPERKVYVFDAPYNQFDTRVIGGRVRRVGTVAAFLDDIEAGR